MRWLITGGCGFIGRNLLRQALTDSNTAFRIVDDISTGTRDDLGTVTNFAETSAGDPARDWSDWSRARVELISADIRDAAVARRVTACADVIVHLAANTGVAPSVADPMHDATTNVIGTLNYLEACRHNGIPRFVLASSGAPIGDCTPPIHEELPAHPVSPYGASKLAGEAYCSAYARSFGVATVALRFGNCYGPLSSHKSSVVAKFIREALAGRPWEIYGDGRQTRDFIYVEDVADAIRRAATADGVGGEVFQIASNAETTILELAGALAAALKAHGVTPPPIRHAGPRIGDVVRNFSDTTKALTRLDWRPSISLDQGLDRTVRWFLDARGAGLRGRGAMQSWLTYWDAPNKSYVSERHKQAHYDVLFEGVRPYLPAGPGKVVLDWGCGDALAADRIAAVCGDVLLYDAAQSTRDRLRQRYAAHANIRILDDTELGPLPNDSVDLVVVNSVVQYLTEEEFEMALARFHGALKPGGSFLLGDVINPATPMARHVATFLGFALRRGFLLAATLGLASSFTSRYRTLQRDVGLTAYSQAQMLTRLEQHGFVAGPLARNIAVSRHRSSYLARKTAVNAALKNQRAKTGQRLS